MSFESLPIHSITCSLLKLPLSSESGNACCSQDLTTLVWSCPRATVPILLQSPPPASIRPEPSAVANDRLSHGQILRDESIESVFLWEQAGNGPTMHKVPTIKHIPSCSYFIIQICQEPVYFSDDPASGCLKRGRLDDTWLLGALGVLASHPGTLMRQNRVARHTTQHGYFANSNPTKSGT